MADIISADQRSQTLNADVYWHYKGDPVQRSQLLGTYNLGAPQTALLPVPTDSDIILRVVPRGARGQTWMAGPADADPVEVHVPGLGTGGGTSNSYQQLRLNHGYSYGTAPTPRPALNLLQSFQIKDDPAYGESDLTTYGVPTGMLNAKTDFNASGQIAVTTGSATTGNLTLAATLDLQPGMGIYVQGAGVAGSPLITTVTAVSADGKTITLASGPFTPITNKLVQADDTAAIQAWVNAKGDLWLPPGYYRLTSSIVLPTTSEGFSVIIHGSGWDQSQFVFQHGGDGFIPTSDLKIDSLTLMDLTVATGTIGDASGTIDAASRGIGLRMTAPSYTGVYNNFVVQRCRFIGWGRWAIWSDNMEVSWVTDTIFRENKSGHVAWVGPDQISPNKQPNANTLTNCTYDQAIGSNDAKRTITGSMSAGNRTLSGSGFTAADRGQFIIVHGAATNNSDLFTFIDTFNSSTSVTLAHQAQVNASGVSVEIFQRNVASILLNRANDTVIDGATIQGNFVGCLATTDINAIKVYNSANLRIVGVHEEDNAGFGGSALRMETCQSVSIENWGGTSAEAGFQNAHRSDFALINCHSVRVAQSFFNDRPQFEIDSSSSEIEIDNSLIVGWINLWQQDNSWDKLRVGSGVRTYQSSDARTNQSCGNEYIYDSLFGRDLITNGRFLDGTVSPVGMEGWTTANPAWWTRNATSQTRYGTYIAVDATAQAEGGVQTILHQAVPIPDSMAQFGGSYTLAFDWYIFNESGSSAVTGKFTEVRLHPSSGLDEAMQWSVRGFPYVVQKWQTAQIKCWISGGTGRTIDVQINLTPGVNNVRMFFANFRLAAGKHVFGAYERAIHDFGGRMHAPFEYAPLAAVPSPPPVGSNIVSLINDAGVLKISSNGSAYAAIAGASGTPAGSGTELQYRATAASFGAVTGSSTANGGVNLVSASSIPLVLQYTGPTTGFHIQDWWVSSLFPIAYIDTQPTLVLGGPSSQAARAGFLQMYEGTTANSVTLGCGPGATQSQLIYFPKTQPTGAGQTLQAQTFGSTVQLQWAAVAASSGHTIAEEGGALTQRTVLNFVGQGITAADDPTGPPIATKVTLNAATVSTEGIVNVAAQTFGGRKTLNDGATIQATGATPALVVQARSGLTGFLQEWKDVGGIFSLGYVDITGNHRHGSPSAYTGTVELCSVNSSFTTKIQCADIPAASLTYRLPAASPAANQVLQASAPAAGVVTLSWTSTGTGGVSGTGTMTTQYLPRWSTPGVAGTITDSGVEDNGSSIILHRGFLLGQSDGFTNLGTTSNRIATLYTRNVNITNVGGTSSNPASSGFIFTGPGEFNRWWMDGVNSGLQTGNNQRLQMYSYHGMELRGNRRSGTPPAYTNIPGTDSSGVLVYQETTDVIPLLVNSAFTISSDLFHCQNFNVSKFRVSTLGTTWMDGGIRNNSFGNVTAANNLANFFNYYQIILDPFSGTFIFDLPLLTAAWHGFRYRLTCRSRSSANKVTIRCAVGNDINESGIGGGAGIDMLPNTAGRRDAMLIADFTNSQWWLGFLGG